MKNKNETRNENINPIMIEKYLKGMQYSATKQDLIDCARDNDAP